MLPTVVKAEQDAALASADRTAKSKARRTGAASSPGGGESGRGGRQIAQGGRALSACRGRSPDAVMAEASSERSDVNTGHSTDTEAAAPVTATVEPTVAQRLAIYTNTFRAKRQLTEQTRAVNQQARCAAQGATVTKLEARRLGREAAGKRPVRSSAAAPTAEGAEARCALCTLCAHSVYCVCVVLCVCVWGGEGLGGTHVVYEGSTNQHYISARRRNDSSVYAHH
jgi:hypothetical protein